VKSIDTILNLTWALLCAGALVFNWWRERQRTRLRSRRVRFWRGLSVFLAVLSFFPCISISDDYARARLQDFNTPPGSHAVVRDGNGGGLLLAGQLEETEHIRPVAPFVLVLVLCCFLVLLAEESRTRRSFHWDTFGRAPPAL
jgi:hypothetical protein